MGERKFLSWPAGWRNALPWGVLVGVVVSGILIVAEGLRSGWSSLDRIFWVDAAIVFAVVVVGFTALTARLWANRNEDESGMGR